MKNITLKYRMILGGMAAVVIPFFIAGTIIYMKLSRSLIEMKKEQAVHIAEDISDFVDATLQQEIRLASAIAADPDIIDAAKTSEYRTAQQELEAIHKRIGREYFTIFITDKYGIIRADALFSKQIGLNLSDRGYFLKAKEGKASVDGPFLARGSVSPQEAIIVVCAPIQDQNEFYGITALAFTTKLLEDVIERKKVGKIGYAFLTDSQGLVLVHPQKEFVLKLRLLDQPGTKELGKIIRAKQTSAASFSFEGVAKIAGLTSMATTNWIAIFAQNRNEIMAPVSKILTAIFISGVIFLMLTIVIIIFFSGKISTPQERILEMMRQVTQNATEIILQIGMDRKIVFANPAFEKLTGIASKNIIGTEPDLNNIGNIPPRDIWDSLKAGITWSGRLLVKGNSDNLIALDVMLIPLRDERGTIQGYLEIGREVTVELLFEKRLQQAQKLEALGTLAGGIAHDFNNILSGIFGYAELTLLRMQGSAETEKNLRQIIRAAERARDLVSQILTFSRQTEVELRPIQPNLVVKEVLKLMRASIPVTIDIQSKIDSNSAIMAEPTQIHQVIMNLFTNAVHAIGENTGTIKLVLEDLVVEEDFAKVHPDIKQGKHILLSVSDTGSGMESEILDKIFEPFFTTKPQGRGTGLGLSVVHGIVKKLNGIITAYSEVGKGTVFNIIIPCAEIDEAGGYPDHAAIQKGTESIALVDDETAIAITLKSILENLGYRVTAFTDSKEALAEIKTHPDAFDVVITDYSMAKITGLGIAKSLKASGISIPVILISGYFSKEIESEARKEGISELITKPVNTYHLTDAIRSVLKAKGADRGILRDILQ